MGLAPEQSVVVVEVLHLPGFSVVHRRVVTGHLKIGNRFNNLLFLSVYLL
jgi:hypothetical protein